MTKAALILVSTLLARAAGAAPPAPADDLPDPPAPGTAPAGAVPPVTAPTPTPTPQASPAASSAPAASPDDKLPPLPRPKPPAGPAIEVPPDAAGPAAPGGLAGDVDLGLGRRSSIGAYGEAQMFVGEHGNEIEAKLRRFVIFLGHRFTDWLRVYAETEVEDGDEIEMEQAYLEIAPDTHVGVRAGLMPLPLGIINQLHEPPTYLTVDRPLTDQLIIPTTWRELGVGLYGEIAAGLRYQAVAVSGLAPTGFSAQAPLVGARGNGREVDVHDPAFAGRLEFAGLPGLNVGTGGYLGWARGGHPELAGVRAGVIEGDGRYRHHGLDLRVEYAHLFIVNSYRLNDYFGLTGSAAIPARGRGYYAQAGYDLFRLIWPETSQELVLFAGYENVNARSRMSPYNFNPPSITGPNQRPPNAPSEPMSFVRAGLTYRPHVQVALKLDVQVALHAAAATPAPAPLPGAPGTLQPLPADAVEAARGESRLGLAVAFMF